MAKKVTKISKTPKKVQDASDVTMTAYQTARERLKEIIDVCERFKVGETGVACKDRLAQSDYRTIYDDIEPLYKSKNVTLINQLESLLIRYAMRYHADKCDNLSHHSHGKIEVENADIYYRVYVVYKLK